MTTFSGYVWTRSDGKMPLDEFSKVLDSYRSAGKIIVTTNGCFDMLHVGHVNFLQQAKALGDVLIVGLNSDSSVRQIKGSERPILSENEREEMLSALKSVDFVVVFDDVFPSKFLSMVKPAIHCKAGDYTEESLPEAAIVRENGGQVQILPVMSGYSTSKTIQRILDSEKTEQNLGINQFGNQAEEVNDFFLAGSNVLRQTGYKLADAVIAVAQLMSDVLRSKHKILVCGNGGSAADAQHFAAELVVRYRRSRQGLPAIALTTDSSILTATGNDFGFEHIFSRQVDAYGLPGDVLVAISTSGKSPNVVAATREAKSRGLKVIGLTGSKRSVMHELSDICLAVPSEDTPLIQQAHVAILHVLCDLIEQGIESA
ncbi:MAG: SIS domain-containing protein [Bacteroidetes bacterium]|nr:SIS domain-containing protein [Bacteroidota bacterium]